MIRILCIGMLLQLSISWNVADEYIRQYDKQGVLKAEGWMHSGDKIGYWYYYHPNGAISQKGGYDQGKRDGYWFFFKENNAPLQEGHYDHGVKVKWWVIYNEIEGQTEKYQYVKGLKEGFCFFYRGKKLFKAEKYVKGQRVNEWTNLASFIADNPNPNFK